MTYNIVTYYRKYYLLYWLDFDFLFCDFLVGHDDIDHNLIFNLMWSY